MAVNKTDLVDTLFNEIGLNKREAGEFVNLFFEKTTQTLENGMAVKLPGFGNFEVRDKNARPGRNPKTGESIPVTVRWVVQFRASKVLKVRIEGALATADKAPATLPASHSDVDETEADTGRSYPQW